MSREPEKLTTMIKDFIEKTSESGSKFSEKLQDLLTAKDLNENTPLHTLAEQTFELEYFEKIFTCLDAVEVLEFSSFSIRSCSIFSKFPFPKSRNASIKVP